MPARKLSDAEVRAIRTDWETRITRRKLAARYGCSVRTIDRILDDQEYRRGQTHPHDLDAIAKRLKDAWSAEPPDSDRST